MLPVWSLACELPHAADVAKKKKKKKKKKKRKKKDNHVHQGRHYLSLRTWDLPGSDTLFIPLLHLFLSWVINLRGWSKSQNGGIMQEGATNIFWGSACRSYTGISFPPNYQWSVSSGCFVDWGKPREKKAQDPRLQLVGSEAVLGSLQLWRLSPNHKAAKAISGRKEVPR